MQPRLRIIPLTLADANAAVRRWHRHHEPTVNHRWSLGVVDEDGILRGAAIASNPVARMLDDGWAIEVRRVSTDGTPNACSCLYGAMRRIAREMGYRVILTYTLASEPGTSLRAAGWTRVGNAGGGSWIRQSRKRNDDGRSGIKVRWECWFVSEAERTIARPVFGDEPMGPLFEGLGG